MNETIFIGISRTLLTFVFGYFGNAWFPILAAEPSPGFNFNIAMYGEQDEELDGTELAAEFELSSLQKFGQEFLKKLRGKKMNNKLLQKVILLIYSLFVRSSMI